MIEDLYSCDTERENIVVYIDYVNGLKYCPFFNVVTSLFSKTLS